MATSGSTDFSINRDELITSALRVVGAVAQGELPTTDQVTEAAQVLNLMVKAWEADGMPLWAMKQTTVPLTDGQRAYTIGVGQQLNIPKPLKVTQAYLRNNVGDIDVPMVMLTRHEYNMLGNKTSKGQPIQYFYDPQDTYGVLSVFPVPDSFSQTNCEIVLVYQRPFEDFDSATDVPDFPQEWYNAIRLGLASELCPEYKVPLDDRRDIQARAIKAKEEALSFGTEQGSFYFQRDNRSW